MTSKEALEELKDNFENDVYKVEREMLNIVEKDLEVLECFRKIPKRKLKEFIENEIMFEKNYNTWLVSCNCDLGKEEQTKHLIKIKEWLENDNERENSAD